MASQYDLLAGLDITSLSSVTQAQLLQMVNQASPLPNIGGVIYQAATTSGTEFVEGANGAPDVTNNPRFARYLWLNTYGGATPQPFYYDVTGGTPRWRVVTVANTSVGNAQLAAHVNALTHMFSAASVDGTLADKVLVYDSSGQFITEKTRSNFMSGYSTQPSSIDISTAAANTLNYLKFNGSVAAWGGIDLTADTLSNRLPLTNLNVGTNGFVLQAVAGNPAWVSNDDAVSNFLPTGTSAIGIGISKLLFGAAMTYPRMNAAASAWEQVNVPVIQQKYTQITAVITGTTVLPVDNTIPQYNEGVDSTLIVSITPKLSTSYLKIEVDMEISHSSGATVPIVAALFTGSAAAYESGTPNALAAGVKDAGQDNYQRITFTHFVLSTSTALRYYGVRFGKAAAGTVRMNSDGTNTLGGVISSTIKITEIRPD